MLGYLSVVGVFCGSWDDFSEDVLDFYCKDGGRIFSEYPDEGYSAGFR